MREKILRYLESAQHLINFVDLNPSGDYETTLRVLPANPQDPDLLARKVYYR